SSRTASGGATPSTRRRLRATPGLEPPGGDGPRRDTGAGRAYHQPGHTPGASRPGAVAHPARRRTQTMLDPEWFDDVLVLGRLPPEQAATRLRELGDEATAAALEAGPGPSVRGALTNTARSWWPLRDRPWQHTAHAFGYLPPAGPGGRPARIQHAGNIAA